MNEFIVNGRTFKPSEPAELFLGRIWSVRARLPALGESEQEFLLGLERQLVMVAFDHPNFSYLAGHGKYLLDCIDIRRDVTLLSLTGEGQLEKLLTLPDTLPADTQVAHETTILKLETEVAAQALGLCPPGVDVEIRRTERLRGLEPGKLVIQMWVGGNPW